MLSQNSCEVSSSSRLGFTRGSTFSNSILGAAGGKRLWYAKPWVNNAKLTLPKAKPCLSHGDSYRGNLGELCISGPQSQYVPTAWTLAGQSVILKMGGVSLPDSFPSSPTPNSHKPLNIPMNWLLRGYWRLAPEPPIQNPMHSTCFPAPMLPGGCSSIHSLVQ